MPFVIDLDLASPSCGAQDKLEPGQRLRCLGIGGLFGAYGLVEGRQAGNVEALADDSSGLAVVQGADCSGCPLRFLPPGTRPISVGVHRNALRMQVLVEEDSDVAAVLQAFKEAGQGPRRIGSREKKISSGVTIPWDILTAKQRETLEVAAAIGYFEPGGPDVSALAEHLGISRSTAHEHLQKALGKLLSAMF